jgi:hypothetical protein
MELTWSVDVERIGFGFPLPHPSKNSTGRKGQKGEEELYRRGVVGVRERLQGE